MRFCALLFIYNMYTNANYDELPHCSSLERCDRLKHEKELLIEEIAKLYCHLQSAEDAIAEHSTKEDLLSQKLNSLSEIAAERDELLDRLDKEMTYKYTLERSLEEQKCRNVELESKAVVFEDKEAMLSNKLFKLEKQLAERDEHIKELFHIIHDYENVLNRNQEQVTKKSHELFVAKSELSELRAKINDIEENINLMQICSSKFNEVEENIQSISSYEGSNLPRNVPDIDHSQSKISVIQSHNEESLIQVQPPTAKINQKSLADELFEMEADHSILLRYGIRNSFTFENKTVEESLRDLSIRLHTFKLELRCKRNLLRHYDYCLLDYEKIHEGKRYWSAEDINDFKCESETYFHLIIKQCTEISVLTGMHFQKAPTLWTNVPSNFGARFPMTLINRSTLETRSSSTHAVFFSGRFGKKGRDTRNGTVKHEKKGVDDWSLVPVITERSQLTKTNYLIANQENETLVNNKLLKSFPASIEQLTDILEADHKTLLCGINMGQLKKTHIEISLTREVLKLGKISAFLKLGKRIKPMNFQNLKPEQIRSNFGEQIYNLLESRNSSFTPDNTFTNAVSSYILTLNKIMSLVRFLPLHDDHSSHDKGGYLRQLLKYLETQIYLFIQELLQYRDPKPMGSQENIHEKTFNDTTDGYTYSFKESNSQNETKSLSQYSNIEMNLKFRNSPDQKSKRGSQMLLNIPNLEKPKCLQISYCNNVIKRAISHTKHRLSDMPKRLTIDLKLNNLMLLFFCCIFCYFTLPVIMHEISRFSDSSMYDSSTLKFYSYIRHTVKNATETYSVLCSKLFDITLSLQYSDGYRPI
ncbi:unnamed protein product [Schistosoma haematobium]|nr:unnamed protein product [Schistosoma haematobium]